MSISRGQWARAVFVLAGNFVFLCLFLAILGLTFVKFSTVSGTLHPETIEYHLTVYAPYFIATTVVAVLWRVFKAKYDQSEIISQFEAAREESDSS